MKQYKLCCVADDFSTIDSLGTTDTSYDQFELQLARTKQSVVAPVDDGRSVGEATTASNSTPTTANRSELLQETNACDANRSAGVEVVTLATDPILCTDTSLSATKTFGDESIAATGSRMGILDLKSKDTAFDPGATIREVGGGGPALGVEVAFAAENTPLMQKLMRYLPLTPHHMSKQRDVKLIFEGGTGDNAEEQRAESLKCVTDTLEGRDEQANPPSNTPDGDSRDEAPTAESKDEDPFINLANEEDRELSPVESASSKPTPRAGTSFLRRARSATGKAMLRKSVSLAEIQCSPTLDPKGTLKEEFETKIESPAGPKHRVSLLLRRNVKSVALGIATNGLGAATGPVRSILRKKTPTPGASVTLMDNPTSPSDSARPITANNNLGVAALSSTRSWQPRSWSKPRARSFARPYADARTGSQGNIELIKHSPGTPHPVYLQSVTFDPEGGGVSRGDTRRKRWGLLRPNKSETIREHDKEDEEQEDDEQEDDEEEGSERENHSHSLRSPSSAFLKSPEGTLFEACSPRSCLPLDDVKNIQLAQKNGFASFARSPSRSNLIEIQAPAKRLGGDGAAGVVIAPPKAESCPITATAASPPLPIQLPRSSSHSSSSHALRRTSSQRSRPTLLYSPQFERHRSLPSVKPNAKAKAGRNDVGAAVVVDDLDRDFERKLTKVAQLRQKPHPSLRDAMEELEVELLEARSFKDQGARQIRFKQIRDKTRQILTEHQRRGKPE